MDIINELYNDLFICYCSYLPRGRAAADANVDDEDQMTEESSPLGVVPHQVTIVTTPIQRCIFAKL